MAKMRLDKLLSHMGHGTRSEVRLGIKKRFASVNGAIAKDAGMQIDTDKDTVTWTGLPVRYQVKVYLMLNKPDGVISATEDSRERTVLDILTPPYAGMALFPVGRLDKDTEGLLLLTNDGDLAHRLLSPKKKVPKTYQVKLDTPLTAEGETQLKAGIPLEPDFTTSPAGVVLTADDRQALELTIYEGRFHQVKRMMHHVGCEVTYLKRLSMGELHLDASLAPGAFRPLTDSELACLGG